MRTWAWVGLVLLVGCSRKARVEAETGLADLLVSERQEEEIGEQVKEELRREGVRFVEDPEVVAYVEDIGRRVRKQVRRSGYDGDLAFRVIDDPGTVNAFAVPGGDVYVFSGLLLAAENEAQVAGVMAHEAGHVAGRHAARQLVYAYGYSALASLALGENPTLVEQIGAQIVGQGFLAQHSQAEELEADRLGVRYVAKAGWDPRGMVQFFRILRDQEGQVPAVAAWFMSHPGTQERIDELKRIIEKRGWEGGEVDRPAHERVVDELRGDQPRKVRQGS